MPSGNGQLAQGPVDCQLTLAATAFRPGDTVTALLQVSCSQPEAVELQEIEIEFAGIERIDTSWVLPTYRRNIAPINNDKRKVQRYVVQSRLQAATQGTFSDLSLRRFVVRFALPSWLPPTFRGTAVRYVYFLQALVKYRAAHPEAAAAAGEGAGADAGASSAPAVAIADAGAASAACRVPLHIWPAKQQTPEGLAAERTPSLLSTGSLGQGPSAAGAPPAQQQQQAAEDMAPIKCWEIGPGTAVQDAVAHIARMASQPQQPIRPHSPGRPARNSSSGGGAAAGAASGGSLAAAFGSAVMEPEGSGDAQEQVLPRSPFASDKPAEAGSNPAPADEAGAPSAPASSTAPPSRPAVHQKPSPLKLPPQHGQHAGSAAGESGSGASTPTVPSRHRSARGSSLDERSSAILRSPSQLAADSGTSLRSYALRIGDQPLVRVSLHPPLEGGLQPGSTLAGTLDFTPPQQHTAGPTPRCMQVLILLETEEIVEAPWRRPVHGGGSGAIRRVYDEHLEVTADTACTHFLFTVPPDAAANFQTPLLQLRWLLRFQFTAAMPPPGVAGARAGSGGADWSPLQGKLEQLSWALPITITSPSS